MSGILQRIAAEIHARRLFARGQKILVAVSGGADSMVLLHVLHSLAPKNRWNIFVAHFNHRLRGRTSEADEKLVRRTAAKLKLPFVAGRADVKAFAKKSKLSIEMAARKLRHEFLARTARERKIATVALAHHADDQVELFFLRLLRGAGGEGLAGMKWRSPSPAGKQTTLVRPLLGCSKAELLAFVRESKIAFREDTSNGSVDFLRNRIRHELLPLIRKKYQPGLGKTVLRLMEIVGGESEFAGATARQWLENKGGRRKAESGKPMSLRGGGFDGLAVAVQRKVLQSRLTESGITGDFDLIERLRLRPGIFVSVGSGLAVARDLSGQVTVRREIPAGFDSDERRLILQGRAGQANFGGKKFRWVFKSQPGVRAKTTSRLTELFDADKVGREILLRHWRPGDRFQPSGMKSPVKLQDLFVNAKIPAARRRQLVLAESAGGIFWVEGLRIGELFKLAAATRRQLQWRWSRGVVAVKPDC